MAPAGEEQVLRAYHFLADSNPDACLTTLRALGPNSGPLGRELMRISRARLAARTGDTATASELFRAFRESGPQLRETLKLCADDSRTFGSLEQAYADHCVLAQFGDTFLAAFWNGLSKEQKYRYACWGPSAQAHAIAVEIGGGDAAALILSAQDRPARRNSGDVSCGEMGAACDAIEQRDPRRALELLSGRRDPPSRLSRAIRLVAEGMLAQKAGSPAGQLFDEAFALGNPVPSLLHVLGEFYQNRPGDHARAFECFTLLERIEPGSTLQYWRALAPHLRLRYAPYLLKASLAAPRPHMHALRRHKQLITKSFGETCLAIMIHELVDGRAPEKLVRLPIASLQAYAKDRAELFEEIAAPRPVVMRGPPLMDSRQQTEITGSSRSFFVCVLKDAVVSGKSNVTMTDDALVMDHQGDELLKLPVHHDFNFAVLAENGGGVATVLQSPEGPTLPMALKLTGSQTSNFGHWTMEYMFQLWACLGRPDFAGASILIDEQMPPQHGESIEFFAAGTHSVSAIGMGQRLRVARLWTCSKLLFWPGGEKLPASPGAPALIELADPDAMAQLIEQIQPALDRVRPADQAPRKLYLTRKRSQSRNLSNRAEIEARFWARGYTVLDLAELTFVEQLRFLRAASIVVLEAGSSVYSLLYCRKGVRIGYFPLYEPPELECIHELFKRLGHRMLTLKPSPGVGGFETLDLDAVAKFIDAVENL
jgi:hypothetical protein